MFLQFTGISLLIHLTIIGIAMVVNMIRHDERRSAFQTYGKQGGVVRNQLTNRIISLGIVALMASYMIGLLTLAVYTALKVGQGGPQLTFYAFLGNTVANILIYLGAHLIVSTLLIIALVSVILLKQPQTRAQIAKYYDKSLDGALQYIVPATLATSIIILKIMSVAIISVGMFRGLLVHISQRALYAARGTYARISATTSHLVRHTLWFFLGMLLAAGAMLPIATEAAIVEPGFESEVIASGLDLATAVAFIPDGRILIAEKNGVIRVVKNGSLLPTPLVTLTDINTFGDRGLLGLAVDPNFSINGYIYLSYTYENTPGLNIAGSKTGRIVRLTVVGDVASESSKVVLVGTVSGSATTPSCEDFAITADCIPSDSNSHSVGGLRFGPDGKLYASLGDGADFTDVDPRALRAQNIDSLGGKVLRLNTDGTAPADNPFYNGDPNANRSKVYALGLRNMFRFNFHPVTGLLVGGDVGWSSWEEVNVITAGANYGWPCREGDGASSYGCTASSSTTDPVYTYPHNASGAGSITGGAFMSNNAYPAAYSNSFFIGDYAQMWMKRLELSSTGAFVSINDFNTDSVWPVEIITGHDGYIYYIDIVLGTLNRLTHTNGNRRPVPVVAATPTSGLTPLDVSFSSAGTVDPDGDSMTYLWQFGDGATSSAADPTHTYNTNGYYDASLMVTDVFGASAARSVGVTVGNQAPAATILTPASGSLYFPLENVSVSGDAIDPETGTLPSSAFSWQVILHHNIHTHTVQQFTGVKDIVFVADDHNDTDVYMEIILTVTDSAGLQDSTSINMYLNNGQGSGNLISNASLETEGAVPTSPLDWYQGWFGVMNPVFTYPVTGLGGTRAAMVEVLSYTSGNAKWYFSPTFVTEGATYDFSNLYTATVPTNVTAQFGLSDGSYQYQYLGTVPATSTPTRINFPIVIPVGVETVTIFHEIDQVGQLIVDDYTLALAGSGDVTPPTGSVTAPLDGDTISGTVAVDVTAADNVGIGSVHLVVDGVEVGVGDSESPYSIFLDTTTLSDGVHTIAANVYDDSGNKFETAAINITVANAVQPNLVYNGDFELTDGTNPLGWSRGGWGTHTRAFTYPVTGPDGSAAAEVAITSYNFGDTGDAKWAFTSIPVTPGVQYTYASDYRSTSISDVIGRYTLTDGTYHYFGLIKEIPASPTWTQHQKSFVPPVNAVSVTFFHLISSVATVAIDNVSITQTGTGTPAETNPPSVSFQSPLAGATLSGQVTLTATATDDTGVIGVYFAVNGAPLGAEDLSVPYQVTWDTTTVPDGSYLLKATAHDQYGNNEKSEITVIVDNTTPPPPATTTNLVLNPTLSIPGTTGNPANWNRGGWGTNDRIHTYTNSGVPAAEATVTITSYTSGDAKWFADPVAITPNTQYEVGHQFRSSASTEALVRYTKTDGTFQYQYLRTIPSTGNATSQFLDTITTPAGVTALTIFHVLPGVGSLTIEEATVRPKNATTTPPTDTVNPSVTITSPAPGTTVASVVAVTATATDNVGVVSTQLVIDGTAVGAPDTTSPYSFSWDSTTVANGAHTILVSGTDAAGNIGNSATVTVTVNNVTPPTGNNLITNGSLETPGTAGNPANWNRGGWGTNSRTYTYPVAGSSGNGAEITISSYTSGDAKWYFDPVAVTPGQQYTFSYRYKANVTTNITLRYTMSDGSFAYFGVANPAASSAWSNASFSFVPPVNATAVTIMHILNQAGTLSIDEHAITSGNTNTFARGMVTFSFDDGWIEHATVARPILDAAGIDGTFNIISNEMLGAVPTERVQNGSLEISGTAGNPSNWNRGGWGINTATLTYPVAGVSGNAAELAMTSYTNGDAKWYADPATVISNTAYIVTESYKSNAPSEILVRYTKTDGTFSYQYLAGLPSSNGTWQTYSATITTPVDAAALTIFHVLATVGTLAVDDLSVKQVQQYADVTQVQSLAASGHEIGSHTKTHTSLTSLATTEKIDEIEGSRQALIAAGFSPVTSIAYPYGDYDDETKTITQNSGLTSGRSVDRGFNDTATDPYALKIQQISRARAFSEYTNWIDQAAASDTWLIFMFHQISDDQSEDLGITQADFTALVNYAANADVDIVTVEEGRNLMP